MEDEGGAAAKCNTNVIHVLQKEVDFLFHFRDHYFENHSVDDAASKSDQVTKKLKATLEHFDKLKEAAESQNRSQYYYLKGKSLNVLPEYDSLAEQALSKAVKLEPGLVEAWNELGECYWKKGDLEAALMCFKRAIQHKPNKVSLRNISIILRQLPTESLDKKRENIEEGVHKAKEALELDTGDGMSWAILGNAHMSSYFNLNQHPKTLKLCLSAYKQAEKDLIARNNPEVHYNKGIALKYEEEYKKALEVFDRACALEPTWDKPKDQRETLLKYLSCVQDFVQHKGKLQARRIRTLIQGLNAAQLGPYQGGSYTTKKGENVTLENLNLSQLQPGINLGKVVLGKVVCSVHSEDFVPFTFCMLDKEERCVAVTVYNLAAGKGVIIGDSVAIPDPYLNLVSFTYKDQTFTFESIRVEVPLVMVVNGRKVGPSQHSTAQMSTFYKHS